MRDTAKTGEKAIDNANDAGAKAVKDTRKEATNLRQNLVAEWNYFFGTVCGESTTAKALQRSRDQGEISETEYEKRRAQLPPSKPCGGSAAVDSEGNVKLYDKDGRPLNESTPNRNESLPSEELLDWNRRLFMHDWEKLLDERFVAGWLIPPEIRGGITWFDKPPGNVTATNRLRPDSGGHPSAGARRWKEIQVKGGKPELAPRLHKGTDHAAEPGEKILAAIDGKLTFRPLKGTPFLQAEIVSVTGHVQQTLYVLPIAEGSKIVEVRRGDVIGVADRLSRKPDYKNTPNHVHTNFISPEGIYIAPNNRFAITGDADWIAKHCKGDNSRCISGESLKPPL